VQPSLRDDQNGTWRVPRGSYFFMGDDRIHSCDSRIWGSVPRDRLVGPVLLTYWPLGRLSVH
jgi:signal peptidase I